MKKLVTQYHDPLMSFFNKRTRNYWDAEEMTQEVFFKIFRRRDLDECQNEEAYLFTVAWSVLRDRMRRDRVRQRDMHVDFDEALTRESTVSLEQVVEGDQQFQCYLAALNELTPKTRDVFIMSRYEGRTYTQIAEHYGISDSAVEKHMMKALSHFKRKLMGN